MSRRDARRHAFLLIYQFPFHHPYDEWVREEALALYMEGLPYTEDFDEANPPDGRDAAYIERATSGTLAKLAQIDGVIEHFLKDWTLGRINRIDLALFRLAIYEMLCEPDVPLGAAINESVELAKAYGSDESPAFVNGVLGGISREIKSRKLDEPVE